MNREIINSLEALFPKVESLNKDSLYDFSPETVGHIAAITFHSVIANHFAKYSISNNLQALHSWLKDSKRPTSPDQSTSLFSLPFADIALRLGQAVNYRQIDEYLGESSLRDEEGTLEQQQAVKKEDERRIKAGLRSRSQLKLLESKLPGWGLDLDKSQLLGIGMYLLIEVMQPKHGIGLT
jgi:hypothetical protein